MQVLRAVLFLSLAASACCLELTDANFGQYVNGSTHAFVKFYAPWCGHCISLAPEWDRLAHSVEVTDYRTELVIAKVDATVNTELARRYKVESYPTLVFLNRGDLVGAHYKGARSLAALIAFVNQQGGLNLQAAADLPAVDAEKVHEPPSSVTELTHRDFDEVALNKDKHVFVAFAVDGCGFCKQLKPEYEKVALAFAREPSVVIARVDAEKNPTVRDRFKVKGFPTLKWFPRDDKHGIDYTPKKMPGRTAAELVEWINERAGTHRTPTGTLDTEAGRRGELDSMVRGFARLQPHEQEAKLKTLSDYVEQLRNADGPRAKDAEVYKEAAIKAMKKGSASLIKERDRLNRVVEGRKAAWDTLDKMAVRRNVYTALLD